MNILRITPALAAAMSSVALASCNSVQDARTEALEDRIDRQNDRIEARTDRRSMRAEAEDQRYHDWYDRVMGRPSSGF